MCLHIILGDGMPNMTLTVPAELHKKMNQRKEIRWSQVAREAFEQKIEELEWMESMLKKSKLTEEDAEQIGNEVKKKIWKRFQKRFF